MNVFFVWFIGEYFVFIVIIFIGCCFIIFMEFNNVVFNVNYFDICCIIFVIIIFNFSKCFSFICICFFLKDGVKFVIL